MEHDKALAKVMLTLLKDDSQVYKQFVENEAFHRFVADMVYALTSQSSPSGESTPETP
jgi:type I restriction enzyme, R subunit